MINEKITLCRQLVEQRANRFLPEPDGVYTEALEAARYSFFSGGKRIRPFVMLQFYRLFGGQDDGCLNFAVALEMIHTYSLIHDDLPCMDNDDFRRGKPSCHKAFGETTALLAGDALLTAAFSAASATKEIPPDRVIRAVSVLSERAGLFGMIGGQMMDLAFEKESPDEALLTEMVQKKTGCLLAAAAEIGAILAGADEEGIRLASVYAGDLGLAFQIVDDILDCIGDPAALGKPVGSDEKNGKTTFVTLLGRERAEALAQQVTERALADLDRLHGDTSDLQELTVLLLQRNY